MYKIAVIGDKGSTQGFQAVGLTAYPVSDAASAEAALEEAAREHAIIYITEKTLAMIPQAVEQYSESRLPAVIPIPGMDGTLGLGISSVKKSVERAVGADILFGGNQ